jgi:hypothetical protein
MKYSSKRSVKNGSTILIYRVKFSCNQRQMKNAAVSPRHSQAGRQRGSLEATTLQNTVHSFIYL